MTRHFGIATALAAGLLGAGAAYADPGFGPHGAAGIDVTAIDTDGNGVLSRDELRARAIERIGAADANGDGALDRDELIAALPGGGGAGFVEIFSAPPQGRMADRILAVAGATEAGSVEVTVLADQRVNMLLARLDADNDAAISAEEAEAGSGRMHDRMARGGEEHGMQGHGRGDGPERMGPEGRGPRGMWPEGPGEDGAPVPPRG